MLRRTAAPVYGLAVVVAFVFCPALAAAQGSDTVYDEAGALSGPEEQRVQQAFDSAQEETGQPLYAFLVPNKGVEGQEAQARPTDQGGHRGASPAGCRGSRGCHERWLGHARTNFSAGRIQYDGSGLSGRGLRSRARGRSTTRFGASPQHRTRKTNLKMVWASAGRRSTPTSSGGGGALLLFRNRRAKRRRIEEERRTAEEEFADLTVRLDEFDEKERLVSGYLEAQRPLLGPANGGVGRGEDLGRQDRRFRPGVQ